MDILSAVGWTVAFIFIGVVSAVFAVLISVYDTLSEMDDLNDER